MMSRLDSKQRWGLAFGGILLTLLMAAVFTFGSLNVPFEPRSWRDVMVLYAVSSLITAAFLVFGLILARTTLRLWAERSREQLGARFKTKMVVGAMAISPDGRFLAIGYGRAQTPSEDCFVCLWEIATGKVAWQRRGHRSRITSVAFAPDGKTLATGSTDTTILLWDLTTIEPGLKRVAEKLNQAELDKFWEDLASADAAEGYLATWTLASRPEQSLAFLEVRLQAEKPVAQPWIDQSITDLNSDDFKTRQIAETGLRKLGVEVEADLRKAFQSDLTLEARRRIEGLLVNLNGHRLPLPALRQLRAVAVLEAIATPEARQQLRHLAHGRPNAPRTQQARSALARLDRPE